jgi:methionyl-tRNA synthetase
VILRLRLRRRGDSRFYLTTPIYYYVNARPHLGHAYSTIVCDAIARRKRALGIETWFLTGHGRARAEDRALGQAGRMHAAGVCRQNCRRVSRLWDRLGLTYDDFIRTTEERHKRGVQKLFATLRDRGFIYKGSYTGQYCVSDERMWTGRRARPAPIAGGRRRR